jgi:glycosidase
VKRFIIAALVGCASLARAAAYPSPNDWRDENIYFIFTDRFNDGDPSNNNVESSRGSGAGYDPTYPTGIHGGDLKGIEKKMDYIKSLGATAIWITPIPLNVSGGAYHGYGAQDFTLLAPHLGTMTDLSNMVAAAHSRGIKVVLDIVCNHSGDLIGSTDSGWSNFKAPPGYNMFYWNSNNKHASPFLTNNAAPALTNIFHNNGAIQNYGLTQQVVLGELSGLDDFATETVYVRTNMVNVYTNWVGQADLDGFRVDTVKHVDYGFWQYWCPQVHQFASSIGKSNFFMFGEVFNAALGDDPFVGSYTGTKGGGPYKLDSVLDYVLYGTIYSVFASASGNTAQIDTHFNQIAANYDSNAWYRLVTFLDNHDNTRFLNNAGNNTNRLTVALTFLYTSRGIPCLYYGTEQAFNGAGDPNNREDMFAGQWPTSGPSVGDNFNESHPLFQLVAKLNNFRRLYASLRRGTHVSLWNNAAGPGLLAYARRLPGEETIVVLNTAATTQTTPALPTTYPAGTVLVNLLNTNETVTVSSTPNIPAISVPSTATRIFIAQSLMQPLDPVVVSQTPAHAATNISTATAIVLKFSKPMDTNSVQSAFSTTPAKSGTFAWSPISDTMTFTPSTTWSSFTTNLIRMATNATDSVNGKTLFAPFETYFVTSTNIVADLTPPTVSISAPTNGATVAGTVSVTGTAADNAAVAKVEISIDGGTWSTASGTTNWSFSLNSQNQLNGAHTISARATDTSSNPSSVPSVGIRIFNVPGAYLTRISAGNPSNVTDCVANVWVMDQAYTPGSFGYSGGTAGYLNNAISNVCVGFYPLYQRERYGNSSYLFDCPVGVYETTLLETENWTNAPNGRVFNVFIESQQVLTNFDIYAAAGGKSIPVTRVFTNSVADAQLQIDFVSVIDNARASGIQVRKIADLDSDGDGIPDWWMLGYFNHATGQAGDSSRATDDPDGDGLNNLQEFLAGTSPLDAGSVFAITAIAVSNTDVLVSWPSVAGKTYQLRRCPDPSTNACIDVGSPIPGSGNILTQPDPAAATNSPPQLYRVRVVP